MSLAVIAGWGLTDCNIYTHANIPVSVVPIVCVVCTHVLYTDYDFTVIFSSGTDQFSHAVKVVDIPIPSHKQTGRGDPLTESLQSIVGR